MNTVPTLPRDHWTDGLAWRLAGSLPRSDVRALCGTPTNEEASSARQRRELVQRAQSDVQLQQAMKRRWREAHETVCTAVSTLSLMVPDLGRQCQTLLSQFEPEPILLELITDEADHGWHLAEEFVASLASPLREQFEPLLAQLAADGASTAPQARVVIFGGHPRDESKLAERLFAGGPFEVRWRATDGKLAIGTAGVTDALTSADAAILITARVSHAVMHTVKRAAVKLDVPLRCIPKATDAQLRALLDELFPDLASDG